MTEHAITPEDEARYFKVMSEYDELMRSLHVGPVPMCHFKAMTQHWDDSHPASDDHWYECEHCGHTEDSAEAWAKVRAREASKVKPSDQEQNSGEDETATFERFTRPTHAQPSNVGLSH